MLNRGTRSEIGDAHARGRHRSSQRRGYARARSLLPGAWPAGELRALDGRQLDRTLASAADLAAADVELQGDAAAGAAGARPGQSRKSRPARHRAGESW